MLRPERCGRGIVGVAWIVRWLLTLIALLTPHSTTLMLDETKIRSKVIAELHVKQIGASIA